MTTKTDELAERVARISDEELGRYERFLRKCQHWPADTQDQREAVIQGLKSLCDYMHIDVRPNGYVECYPHSDFDGPCTGQCCEPEAYASSDPRKPLLWSCEGRYVGRGLDAQFVRCWAQLIDPGQCQECSP